MRGIKIKKMCRLNFDTLIILYNAAIRKEGGYPERDGGGEEEEEELQIFT